MFKKAADTVVPASAGDVNLGTMMIRGEGGAKEVGKGFTLIEKAARRGNKYAVKYLKDVENASKTWKIVGVHKSGTI